MQCVYPEVFTCNRSPDDGPRNEFYRNSLDA
jgi:hypothetical protein